MGHTNRLGGRLIRRQGCDLDLSEPLEEGRVMVVRPRAAECFPARFTLVAALNPCPCGFHGSVTHPERCTCQPPDVRRYLGRISGPLLDRVDLRVDVPALSWSELRGTARGGETSTVVRARVKLARRRAMRRGEKLNAEISHRELRRVCRVDAASEGLLERAVDRLGLSARGCHRVLRVARTVADLAGSDRIGADHVAEALGYRVET